MQVVIHPGAALNKRYVDVLFVIAVLAAAAGLAALTWVNYRYSVQNPGGSDFVPRWVGTRLFLMNGQSPYSDATTTEIQKMFYGRQARPGEDQVLFAYPLYSIFIFGPFAMIEDFNMARAVWMTILEVAALLLTAAGLSLARWRPPALMLAGLLIFALLWYYGLRTLINANAGLLIALFVSGVLLLIRSEQDGLAGVLLALSTFKPQVVLPLVILVLLWAASRRRWVLFWSFLGSLALLVAVMALLIPNWIWQDFVQIAAYPEYTMPKTPGEIFTYWMPGVGRQMGWAVTVLAVGTMIWEWRSAWNKDFRWFLWAAYLTLALTPLTGLQAATENYMVMLPAVLLIFAAWDGEWGPLGRVLITASCLVLFFGLWALFLVTLQRGDQPVQGPIMFFPLPIFVIAGLYWVRWWVLRPEQPLLDRWRRVERSGSLER
jgi:hypothetical protein